MKNILLKWNQTEGLVKRILLGIIIGILLAVTIPDAASWGFNFCPLF